MSKVTDSEPISRISGRVFGPDSKTHFRVINGTQYTYTYLNKPEQWSEAQIAHRRNIGAAAYYARLIRKIPEAEACFRSLLRKQKKYHRLDNLMAGYLTDFMNSNETLHTIVFTAYDEQKALMLKTTEHEAALARHATEAQAVWQNHLRPLLIP